MSNMTANVFTNNAVPKQEQDPDCFISRKGVRLFNYTVPWWVIIVIALLVFYLSSDQGWFATKSDSQSTGPLEYPSMTQVGGKIISNLDTPECTRELLRNANW